MKKARGVQTSNVKTFGRKAKGKSIEKEKRDLAQVERENAVLDAELKAKRNLLQEMRSLWLSLIRQGKIQYGPAEEVRPPQNVVTNPSALEVHSLFDFYMQDFNENYKDNKEPFDNLEDDLPGGDIDNIPVDPDFWLNA